MTATVQTQALPAEWRDFFALTKPRVMSLVVFTGLCGLLAAPVPVHPVLGFTAVLCIALGAGAAGALNQWYEADLDAPYGKSDILQLCRDFYAGIGLPIDAVLARSDLYEKPGKSPHAFCTDIDREGDVRVLANIVPNEYWMGTMLHELGHSVYSSHYIPPTLPHVLRDASHILTTEGVAMQFERFSKNRKWLETMGVGGIASVDRKCKRRLDDGYCNTYIRFSFQPSRPGR